MVCSTHAFQQATLWGTGSGVAMYFHEVISSPEQVLPNVTV